MRALAIVVLSLCACSRTGFFPFAEGGPPSAICGDGDAQGDEICDDGNRSETDGCRANCVPNLCGDGVVFAGVEVCDDGNAISGDGCEPDCAFARCGDGILQPADERCDDQNDVDTDECLSTCLPAFCGDGFVRAGVEMCDDANTVRTDGCIECRPAFCGDGDVRRRVEDCDDQNRDDLDGCSNACKAPVCGDGLVSAGETCDLGADNEDTPALRVLQGGGLSRAVQPRLGGESAAEHYGYSSASSHMGIESVGEGRIFVYLDRVESRLSLFLNYGADGGGQPGSKVQLTIRGVPAGARVVLADDDAEELHGGDGVFTGDLGFEGNSDGGVIGDLPFPGSWTITIEHRQVSGIDRLVFMDGDARIPLDPNHPIVIESRSRGAACGSRCTVPRCGDGRLDPGELCDSSAPLCGPTCGPT